MSKNNTIAVVTVIIVCGLLVAALGIWFGTPTTPKEEVLNTNENTLVVPLSAESLKAYQVSMTNEKNPVAEITTNHGTFELELFEDTMPITAGNFIKLATEGFYDGVQFHRVIDGFMIQGGDPITKTDQVFKYGTGGSGQTIPDEFIEGQYLTNVRGTISMANSGPNSGSSQFFINVADNVNLDFDKPPFTSKHPVFGRVLSGMEVVDEISMVETNERDLPMESVLIESIKIRRAE